MKDRRGVEIQRGDTVIHSSRRSSSMWMDVGIVTEVSEYRVAVAYEDGTKGKPYTSRHILVVNGVPDAENQA